MIMSKGKSICRMTRRALSKWRRVFADCWFKWRDWAERNSKGYRCRARQVLLRLMPLEARIVPWLNAVDDTNLWFPTAGSDNVPAGGVSAEIDWGDGSSPSTGTCLINGNHVDVSGYHDFDHLGLFTIKTTLSTTNGPL